MSDEAKTLDDTERQRDAVKVEISKLKLKLDGEEAYARTHGAYRDTTVVHHARHAYRTKLAEINRLNAQIAELKRRERMERNAQCLARSDAKKLFVAQVEHQFVNVARELLDRETFWSIMTKAREVLKVEADSAKQESEAKP